MIGHVSITVGDLSRAERFYDAVVDALGYPCAHGIEGAICYGARNAPDDAHSYISVFAGSGAIADRRHRAFGAASRDDVDRFRASAFAAGARNDGEPGLRPEYHPAYCAASVADPDGYGIGAVFNRRAEV